MSSTLLTRELEWWLREQLENGTSLRAIARMPGSPCLRTLQAWMGQHPSLGELYQNQRLLAIGAAIEADMAKLEDLGKNLRAKEARNRRRKRDSIMKERHDQMRRAVELRAGGRSGVRIAARLGIALRTLRNWQSGEPAFRVNYETAYRLWKAGDDEGIQALLKAYHPERESRTPVLVRQG